MAGNALKLTRVQLAAFLPDEETIRKFELLVSLVDQINTTSIDELQTEVGVAVQKANEAIDRFYNIYATSINLDVAAFNALLSAADDTVQKAINTLDDHNHDGRYYTETELDAGQLDNRYYTETEIDNALALKAPLASPTFTGTVSGITKLMVGLGNVDDTSDANKPVSTATQTALDLKANIFSGTWTPSLGGTTTYSVQQGRYIKLGDMVTAWFDIEVSTIGTGSTSNISGLPHSSATGGPEGESGSIGYFNALATAVTTIFARIDGGTSTIQLTGVTGASTNSTGTSNLFGNGTRITGSIIYEAS
jgi:hypothetical protein